MPPSFSKTGPQQQRPYKVEPFIIEIDLTPPSTPQLSYSESDLDLADEIDELSLDCSETSSAPDSYASSQTSLESLSPAVQKPKPLSVLGQLLEAYRNAKGDIKKTARQGVIDYIHSSAVGLADVELLIPAYNHDKGFIHKLVSALGHHCATGRIPNAEKEAIFTRIFTHGDDESDVYNRIHARIKHFQKTLKHLQKNQGDRAFRVQQERRQQEQTLAKRIQEFPLQLREPVPKPEFLPIGATTVAEIYVKLLGLKWDEVRHFKTPSALAKLQSCDTMDVSEPSFAATRPSLSLGAEGMDSPPKVNIPPKEAQLVPACGMALDEAMEVS